MRAERRDVFGKLMRPDRQRGRARRGRENRQRHHRGYIDPSERDNRERNCLQADVGLLSRWQASRKDLRALAASRSTTRQASHRSFRYGVLQRPRVL